VSIGLHFKSIAARLVAMHVAAILVASLCLPLMLFLLLRSQVDELHRDALLQQAEEISHYLHQAPDGSWRLELPAPIESEYVDTRGRNAYAVIDAKGKVLTGSLPENRPLGGGDTLDSDPAFFIRRLDGRLLAAISMPVRIEGERFWVQAAINLSHRDVAIDDLVAGFLYTVAWVTVPALALLLAVDLLIFRRALRPLREASKMVEQIGPTRVDLRLPTQGMPGEVAPLIAAFNQALDRLEHGFRVQREFTADAAHELRTPLAILLAHVDVLPDKGAADALRQDVAVMRRLVDQLLQFTEVDTLTVASTERADLAGVCTEVASFLAPLAVKNGREIAVFGADRPVLVRGNAEALFQAVRNLADNALRHTPAGTVVEIHLDTTGRIDVLDAGPGIKTAERELLFRRFWRRDRRESASAGLGLSIVARIAEAHGGRIEVENRPQGGAAFTLDLSAAAAS
jgi:signal transduction histidine kinase